MVAKLFRAMRKFGYPKPFSSSVPGKDNAMRRKSSVVMWQLYRLEIGVSLVRCGRNEQKKCRAPIGDREEGGRADSLPNAVLRRSADLLDLSNDVINAS